MVYDPWQSIQPLWLKRTSMLDIDGSEEKRKPAEREIVRMTIEITRELIDNLYSKPPSRDELSRLIRHARTELTDAKKCYTDEDERAELWYQQGNVDELAILHFGRYSVTGDQAIWVTMCYEQAIQASKKGSGRKLASYQERLTTFRKRYPITLI